MITKTQVRSTTKSQDIGEFLKVLDHVRNPDDYFAVYALDVPGYNGSTQKRIGYFRDVEQAVKAIKALEKENPVAIFCTLNPVDSATAAKSAGKMKRCGTGEAVDNSAILRRQILLIDIDPVRPSGVSSTNAEMNLSLEKANLIADYLQRLGWPDPLRTMSGNGAGLLYRIEEANSEEADQLISSCLESLDQQFSDDHVHVDTSVSDAKRLTKIAGTWARKGSDFQPDELPIDHHRPHRRSWFTPPNDPLTVVTTEQLKQLANEASVDVEDCNSGSTDRRKWLDDWLSYHGVNVGKPEPWGKNDAGRRWQLKDMPLPCYENPTPHEFDNTGCLLQLPNGAIVFKCMHNRCKDKKWADFRRLTEEETNRESYEVANLSAVAIDSNDIPTQSGSVEFRVPGFIQSVMNLTLESAAYPNESLAFCGALTLLSVLASRKITFQGLGPNLYVLALANSGGGKDQPRKVSSRILGETGLAEMLGNSFASGEGIEDAIYIQPAKLFQADEFDVIISAIASGKESRHQEVSRMLLQFFTESTSTHYCRAKAGELCVRTIDQPGLVLFATCIPSSFYESLSSKLLSNGLISRTLIVEVGKRGKGQRPKPIEVTADIKEQVAYWRDLDSEGSSINPKPREMAIDEAASIVLDAFRNQCDEKYAEHENRGDNAGMAIWARGYELACKLAMIHSASSRPSDFSIDRDATKWATRFAFHQIESLLSSVATCFHESDFDRLCQKALKRIESHPSDPSRIGITQSDLLRYLKIPKRDLIAVTETLVARQQVAQVELKNDVGRAATVFYRL
jgi:hypothetical protein